MIPVILSGGSGTRLWPLSRASYPKQFLPLISDLSLFQDAILRLTGNHELNSDPIIVGNHEHRFVIAEQCRAVNVTPAAIILEPFGRNTAAAIVLACLQAKKIQPDAILLVMPADHLISDMNEFRKSVDKAMALAKSDRIVTFGVVPTYAETGYGYIRVAEKLAMPQPVDSFVEKPDLQTALSYLAAGNYYWNSGVFLFKADVMLEEIKKFSCDVFSAVTQAFDNSFEDLDFLRIKAEDFEAVPSDSIDYAVLEKSDLVSVVPLDAKWNDIGSWSSIWDVAEKNENGNAFTGDAIMHEVSNSYVHASGRLVALLGVDNLVVVETNDAVMIANKDRAQDVKSLVDIVKKSGKTQASVHRKVYRPWGHYDSIENGHRFQVKLISVAPGQKISVQMHHHRAEHWVIVAGTAKVVLDGVDSLVTENQSVYIPVGAVHSLENPGKIPLEMIEVQSGAYLGEDDIVRYSDMYGRVKN